MPWEKTFDRDAVLDRAMDLFWERGYQGVSMSELVAELGVNRSSLYATYGQKQDLFAQALARYDRIHREAWLAELSDRMTPIDAIRQAFVEVVGSNDADGLRRLGCLLVNTTLELPPEPTPITELVQTAFGATEQFFANQLTQAVEAGEISDEVDVTALAAALIALLLGIRVLSRSQWPAAAIEPILSQVDAMLQVA